jgi:hypothetical protein
MAYKKIKDVNILVDTRSSVYGDNFDVNLGEKPIIADNTQFIRMNLTYFSMYNNLYGINSNNGKFIVDVSGKYIRNVSSNITYQNYYSIHEIASEFAVKLGLICENATDKLFRVKEIKNTILNKFTPFLVGTEVDSTAARATHDGNHLLDITLEAVDGSDNVINHGISDFKIFFGDSDLYLIVGGIKDMNTRISLLDVTINTRDINIRGYFPMQRVSDTNIYLRCNEISNSFASTVSIYGDNAELDTHHYTSDILAIFNSDSEIIEYVNSNNIFSADLKRKQLQTFNLRLTDSKNRPLVKPVPEGTAAGLTDGSGNFISNFQNTRGNLNFKALLNIEVLQVQK